MISVKRTEKGHRRIQIEGNNLELLADLLVAIDTVTKTVFKDSDRDRIDFIKDIPCLVIGARTKTASIELPCSLEELKKLGGDNT